MDEVRKVDPNRADELAKEIAEVRGQTGMLYIDIGSPSIAMMTVRAIDNL